MNSASVMLLSNAGVGNGAAKPWPGGRGLFMATATFGGGTVSLEYLGPNNVWLASPVVAVTAAGGVLFELPPGSVRGVSVTATAVYACIARIPT